MSADDLTKAAGVQAKINQSVITSQISLTRGTASGLLPVTECERLRTYSLKDPNEPERSYAAEIAVDFPIASDIVDIRIQPPSGPPSGSIVRLKSGASISIANSPIAAGKNTGEHFKSYSRLLGFPRSRTVGIFHHEYCVTGAAAAGGHVMAASTKASFTTSKKKGARIAGEAPNPPDAGCLFMTATYA